MIHKNPHGRCSLLCFFFSLHVCLCDWHDCRLSLQIDNVYYPSIKAVACKCVAFSVTHSSQVMADGIQTTEYARHEPNFAARVVFPFSRFYVWKSMFLCSGYKMHFPVLASVLPLTWRRKDNFVRNLRSSSWWHYFVIFWMKSRDMRFIDGFREAVSIQKEHTFYHHSHEPIIAMTEATCKYCVKCTISFAY